MSMRADIEQVFDVFLKKHPELKQDIMDCKFGVFEALEWDEAAGEVVQDMIADNLNVDGNMQCYLRKW